MSDIADTSPPDSAEFGSLDSICWRTTVNNRNLSIKANMKHSSMEDVFVELFHIYYGDTVFNFVGRIINKEGLKKRPNNFDSVYLIQEAAIRSSINFKGLCNLLAIRDSSQYTYLFEEYCDMGTAMIQKGNDFSRPPETLFLQKYLEISETPTTVYSEKEASYIMWRVFHSLQELHVNQICHLDICPNNIYLTSSHEIKLGGTHYLTDFSKDLFSGIRKNLPGNIHFLQPEYWQTSVSLYVLVKGKLPFNYESLDSCLQGMNNYSALPEMEGFSFELRDLLSACLSPCINKRLTIKQILSHRWFTKHITSEIRYILALHLTRLSTSSSCILPNTMPSRWTMTTIPSLEVIIDSCFDHFSKYICGDLDFLTNLTITPQSGSSTSSGQPTPQNIQCSLPKQGAIRLATSEGCWICWKKSELYVERGKMVIGGIRKPNAIVISVVTIQELGSEKRNVIRIGTRDQQVFYLKVKSQDEVREWIEAIRLSMRLAL